MKRRSEIFNKDIEVSFDEDVSEKYVEKCFEAFNNLEESKIDELCDYFVKYAKEFSDEVGESALEIENNREILEHIFSVNLIVRKPLDESRIIYNVSADCTWEVEHGLEWTMIEDDILFVGGYHNVNAWDKEEMKFYKKFRGNYARKESFLKRFLGFDK